jgi:hypothetical protein
MIVSGRKLKTRIKKRTRLSLALEESAKEILAHARGERKLPVRRVVLPDDVDVIRVRKETGMSQAKSFRSGSKVAESRMQPLAPTSR